MATRRLTATRDNFTGIRGQIERLIDQYRINTENWVIARFRRIPLAPNPDSILELDGWIKAYLPEELAAEIQAKLDKNGKKNHRWRVP